MKVFVDPKLVCGTRRGGEDLLLHFEARHDGTEPPVNEEIEAVVAIVDNDVDVEILDEIDDDFDEKYANIRVRYTTPYEFMWEGNGATALLYKETNGRVMEYFQDPANWRFCHSPGQPPQLICSREVWIDGNAD